MAAQVRQEISILTHLLTAATGATATSNEIVQYDETQYNGTVTAYFEIVAYSDTSLAFDVTLVGVTDGTVATINVPTLTTAPTLFRSASFNPTTATQNYTVVISAAVGTNKNVKSARIVIIQNATTLTNTETQVEIGNYNLTRTTESAAILTNPKYWKYTAANWDGTKTFYAEAVYDSGDMDTISVYIYEATDILAPSWTLNATIVSAATTTVPTRTRVAFTPVDGRWYTIFSLNGSMDNHDIYRAGVVVQSTDGVNVGQGNTSGLIQGGTAGAGQTFQAMAQSFKIRVTSTITGVKLRLRKADSPTDTLNIDIVSSLGGSSLANATQSASALTTSFVEYTYTFGSPVSLTGGSTYYIQLTRSPDTRDGTNYMRVEQATEDSYSDGSSQQRDNNSWSAQTPDLYFVLIGQAGITKLEPQYLLANTLLAAGTALQTFLTTYTASEFDDEAGTTGFTFQGEAANGSTSDMTLQEADGGGAVTNSTLTNIDNAQISAAMTMPADQNLDVIANANAGDVAAARILVAYVFSAVAAIPNKVYKYMQAINRSNTF